MAQKKKVIWVIVFLMVGVVSCSMALHVQKMMSMASQEYWEAHKLIGVSLYQKRDHEKSHQVFSPFTFLKLQKDLKAQQIEMAAYQAVNAKVTWQGQVLEAQVVGVEPVLLQWLDLELEQGRLLSWADEGQKVAVMGSALPSSGVVIFNQRDGLWGIGRLRSAEVSPWFDFDLNRCLLVPLSVLPSLGEVLNPKSLILKYQHQTAEEAQIIFTKILAGYLSDSVFFQNPQDWGMVTRSLALFHKLLWFFSGLMVFLGFVFMVQMMRQLLIERRYELGLRMALGATQKECVLYLMAQVLVLVGISSGLGFILTFCLAAVISYVMDWPWALSALGLWVGVILMFISIGVVGFQLRAIYKSLPVDWLR